MFNMLCMDLRRLFKSRSLYAVLGIAAVLLMLTTVMARSLSDPETLSAMAEQGAEVDESDRMMGEYLRSMPPLELMHEALGSGFLLVMTGIGMTLFVNSDFSNGFIKNTCCIRPRRRDYVFAKVLLAGVYSGIVTALSVLLMLLVPLLIHMYPAPDAPLEILRYALWMWPPHWTFALMALALVLLTRSSTLGIILSLVAGSGLSAVLLGTLGSLLRLPPFERYFLAVVVRGMYTPESGITSIGSILACTAAWAVVYGAGSLISMKKRDI